MHSPHDSKSTSTAIATSTSTITTVTVSEVSQPELAAGQRQHGYFMGFLTTPHTLAGLTQIPSTYYQQDELRFLSDASVSDISASQNDPLEAHSTYITATFGDDHQRRSARSLSLSNEPARSQKSSQLVDDIVPILREEQSPDRTDKLIMNSGDETMPFQCRYEGCGRKYALKAHLQAHFVIHTSDSKFRCYAGDCTGTVRFCDKRALTRHIRARHTFERPYQCEICKKWYRRTDYLKFHKEHVHSPKKEKKSPKKQSVSKSSSAASTSTITSGNSQPESTQIPEADQQFSGLRLLAEVSTSQANPFEALATHQTVSFEDEQVTTGIARDHNLPSDQHLAKQSPDPIDTNKWIILDKSQERPYRCGFPECDKNYKSRRHLKRHFIVHTGVSNYGCTYPECVGKKYFRDHAMLSRHIISTHSLEKPFQCDRCNKRFKRKERCTYHKKHVHSREHEQKSPKRKRK